MKTLRFVSIDGKRTAYNPVDIVEYCDTLTVGELIEILSGFDDDLPVVLNNDNGYTYGEIVEYGIEEAEYNGE